MEKRYSGNMPTWKALVLSTFIVGGLSGAMYLTMWALLPHGPGFQEAARSADEQAGGLFDPAEGLYAVTFRGERLAVVGGVVNLDPDALSELGVSAEGYRIFALETPPAIGGGGGAPGVAEDKRLYVQSVDGDYREVRRAEE